MKAINYWQRLKKGFLGKQAHISETETETETETEDTADQEVMPLTQISDAEEPTERTAMRRALFLHIQKTAGTSVQEMARATYGNDQVASHGDYSSLGHEGCRKYDFLSGHFGFEFARLHMEDRYCFTFLRDPIERLRSLYEFCKTRETANFPLYQVAQNTDLEGFLSEDHGPEHLARIWNNQTLQLTHGYGQSLAGVPSVDPLKLDPRNLLNDAKSNLEKFDYIGFVPTFDSDIQKIFSALGASPQATRRSNVGRHDYQSAYLSPTTRSRLEKMTELDRDLYEHAMRVYGNTRT